MKVRLETSRHFCQYGENWLTGARALDFCRYHGMPESTEVPVAATYCGAGDLEFELPERIARELLSDTERTCFVTLHPSDMAAGEIVKGWAYGAHTHSPSNDYPALLLNPSISLERALVLKQMAERRIRAEEAEKRAANAESAVASLRRRVEELESALGTSIT